MAARRFARRFHDECTTVTPRLHGVTRRFHHRDFSAVLRRCHADGFTTVVRRLHGGFTVVTRRLNDYRFTTVHGHCRPRPRNIETQDVPIGLMLPWVAASLSLVPCAPSIPFHRMACLPLFHVNVYPPTPPPLLPRPACLVDFLPRGLLCTTLVGDKRPRFGAVDAVAQAASLSSSEAMQAAKSSVLDKLEGASGGSSGLWYWMSGIEVKSS